MQVLTNFYRCPEGSLELQVAPEKSAQPGFFRFGEDTVCFGHASSAHLAPDPGGEMEDLLDAVRPDSRTCVLPFDPAEVVDNLRLERYVAQHGGRRNGSPSLHKRLYYALRPALPVALRKHLQRMSLNGWEQKTFPSWPVDRTADRFLERLLAVAMRAQGIERIPFIWFWPQGHTACAIVTHDVETLTGLESCPALMDLDESFGIRTSFQLVPEVRYTAPESLREEMRRRGFEINIHDLNHDGRLYWNREEFLRRAAKINAYGKEFGARGFRAGALYRNVEWFDALEFEYEMSVPGVAHLDPQPGGCCTLMPYFVGRMLELPVTVTQDYPLFHILRQYSIDLWQRQFQMILQGHGMIGLIVHPDYVIERRARSTYADLLGHLARLRSDAGLWITLPGEVNDWWRARSRTRIVRHGDTWQLDGPARDRGRIAWAHLAGERVVYSLESEQPQREPLAVERITERN